MNGEKGHHPVGGTDPRSRLFGQRRGRYAAASHASDPLDEWPVTDAATASRRHPLRLPPTVVLFVALSFANGSNYMFQVVMSRLLGPSDYSLLGGVYAIITVVAVSTQALQTASAKVVAAQIATGAVHRDDSLTKATVRRGGTVMVFALVASPLIARFLHSGLGPVIGLALYIVPVGLLAIGFGRLQGSEAFVAFAVLSVALALGRLVVGPLAFAAGLGVTGIVVGSVGLTAVAAGWALRRTSNTAGAPVEALRGDIGRAGIAIILFWAMASIDVPIARHFLHPHEAGQYAAASVIGKAIIWLPGALSLVMFPRVTSRRERGEHTHPPLVRAFVATFLLCAAGVVGLKVLGPTMIPLFFGDDYKGSVSLAWKVGLVCLPFALANLLLFYHLTRGTAMFLVGVGVSIVVESVSLVLFHDSPDAIVFGLGAGGVALLLCLLVPGVARRMGFRLPRASVIGTWFSASSRSR